jgi:hypothetical protein
MPPPSSKKSNRWFDPLLRTVNALVTAVWLCLSLTAVAFAGTSPCRVCEKPIAGDFFFAEDKARGGKYEVCGDCLKLEAHCFACGLPVKKGFTTLPDGRILCVFCARDAIGLEEEAKKICLDTRDDLDRLFWRHLSFPQTNVVLTIVDRFTLESLFKSPGYARECSSVLGATQSHAVNGGSRVHAINILSSLNKPQLETVAAHEFGHAWINENLLSDRKAALSPDALEAFCELIAYSLMEDRRAAYQKKAIKENPYTRGQLDAFITAEARHGFHAILDWMKSGETDKLDAADPDGVRATQATGSAAAVAALPAYLLNAPPSVLPEKLTLRTISGSATKRLAIINDRTFATMELARVRLASTNVMVRCLEIRTNSVLVRFEDSGAKLELFLPED